MTGSGTARGAQFDRLGFDRPHSARMYDFFLGGKTHYAVDRKAAIEVAQGYNGVFVAARQNRDFMHRVTRRLAREYGLRQWLDIGTGIPTEPNLHQIAQSVAPGARVVYVDNDPIVLTYARALLKGAREGSTAYIEADAHDPQRILDDPQLRETLDLREPVVLSLNALLHFAPEPGAAEHIIATLTGALAPGSVLTLTHATADFSPQALGSAAENYRKAGIPVRLRDHGEVTALFAGLELLEPGVVAPTDWHPEETADGMTPLPGMVSAEEMAVWAGVAVKR